MLNDKADTTDIPTKTSDLTNDNYFNYSTEVSAGTIDWLAEFTSGKQGLTGSISLIKKSSGVGSEIPAGWYNYYFSPHRTGVNNGTGATSDNNKYGTIILTPMTFSGKSWILRRSTSTNAITEVKEIATGHLEDYVKNNSIVNENLFIKETAVKAYIVADGTLATPDQYNLTSDYITVTAGEKYTLSLITPNTSIQPWSRCAWYNANKEFISLFAYSTGNYNYTETVTAPTNAVYARLSARYLQIGHDVSKLKFEKGELATDWCLSSADKSVLQANVDNKEYTGIYGSANDQAGASFYFGSVKPSNWYDMWRVKFRVYASIPNQNNYKQYSEVTYYGNQTEVSYWIFNRLYSTSARCYYYNNLCRLNSTGFNAGYGHILGMGLRSSNNPTSSSYPRTFNIEILETENCTVTLWDTMKKIADVSEYSTTNYSAIAEYDGANNGLRETGDDTNIWQLRHNNGTYITTTNLYRYQICFTKNETQLIPANAVNNSTATNKTLTTEEFDPYGNIMFYNSTTAINANAAVGASALYYQVNMDLRYSFNTGSNLTNNKAVYLVCSPQSNGKVKLHSTPITQTLPSTEDGLIYIFLGTASSTYQMELNYRHPIYEYKNGQIQLYKRTFGLEPRCIVGSDNASTNGWYKIATSTMSNFTNQNILYYIKDGYLSGQTGILELEMRADSGTIQCWQVGWLTRNIDLPSDSVRIVIDGMTWTLYFKRRQQRYGRVYFTEISNRDISGGKPSNTITYFNGNDTPETTEPVASATSSDISAVGRATGDKNGADITTTYYKASNPNGYTSNTGTITGISLNGTSIASSGVANLVTNTAYNSSTNPLATMADVGSGGVTLEDVYPVGSIYMSVTSTSPATLFGFGTWEQIKDTFLLSAGDTYTAGSTGGEATHTLTIDEMPSHSHYVAKNTNAGNNNTYSTTTYLAAKGQTSNGGDYRNYWLSSTSSTADVLKSSNVGGSQAHNNMPPYLTVYMWKRTA